MTSIYTIQETNYKVLELNIFKNVILDNAHCFNGQTKRRNNDTDEGRFPHQIEETP